MATPSFTWISSFISCTQVARILCMKTNNLSSFQLVNFGDRLKAFANNSLVENRVQMEVIFDCFFDETFARLERSGLKGRQKRKDVIDHLNTIIMATSTGLFICI